MKIYLQTICVFVIINLAVSSFAVAKNAPDEEVQKAVEVQAKAAELAQKEAEIAAEVAQKRAGVAQRQASIALVAQGKAVPTVPSPPTVPPPPAPPVAPVLPKLESVSRVEVLPSGNYSPWWSGRSGSTGPVLVIPSEQTKTEDLITINEDMSVMSRIFEKNLEQARIETARGNIYISRQDPFSMLLGGGRGGIQSIYLQGFGALFLMKVDFPLKPPPGIQDDEKETQKAEQGDPVWQQIRREMYEPEKVVRNRRTDRPEDKYDAAKVENLKTALIKALKHAANIRSLKPNESVILTVIGKGEATGIKIEAARELPGENQILIQERTADGKTFTKLVTGRSLDDIGLSSPAILVIRTKKSDIDAFAKGDLDFDQFSQRVQMLTYPSLDGVVRGAESDPLQIEFRKRR